MAIRSAARYQGAANRSPCLDACGQRVGGGAGSVKSKAWRDHWGEIRRILTSPGTTGSNSGPFAAVRPVSSVGQVAQLVEQRTENPGVGGSIPPLATIQRRAPSGALLCMDDEMESLPEGFDSLCRMRRCREAQGCAGAARPWPPSSSQFTCGSVSSGQPEGEKRRVSQGRVLLEAGRLVNCPRNSRSGKRGHTRLLRLFSRVMVTVPKRRGQCQAPSMAPMAARQTTKYAPLMNTIWTGRAPNIAAMECAGKTRNRPSASP